MSNHIGINAKQSGKKRTGKYENTPTPIPPNYIMTRKLKTDSRQHTKEIK